MATPNQNTLTAARVMMSIASGGIYELIRIATGDSGERGLTGIPAAPGVPAPIVDQFIGDGRLPADVRAVSVQALDAQQPGWRPKKCVATVVKDLDLDADGGPTFVYRVEQMDVLPPHTVGFTCEVPMPFVFPPGTDKRVAAAIAEQLMMAFWASMLTPGNAPVAPPIDPTAVRGTVFNPTESATGGL